MLDQLVQPDTRLFAVEGRDFAYLPARNALFEIDAEDRIAIEAARGNARPADAIPVPAPAAPARPVLSLTLMVVQECNLACLYCYGGEGEYKNRGRMSVETALASVDHLFDRAGNAPEVSITFFGGEPLLNWPVVEAVVGHARAREAETGIRVGFSMTCNGTLLDAAKSDFLVANRVSVLISIDGDAAAHDGNRPQKGGRGSHAQIVSKTEPLRNARKLSARATVTPNNAAIDRQVDHLLKLGFRGVAFSPALDMMTPEAFAELDAAYDRLIDRFAGLVEAGQFAQAARLRNIYALLERIHSGRRKTHFCGAGTNMMAVDKDGEFYPCHRFVGDKRFVLGGLGRGEEKRAAFIAESAIDARDHCGQCWARNLCGGGCHHENVASNGTLALPNADYCRSTRSQLDRLLKVYAAMTPAQREDLFPA